jgi:type II secretory pathway pseudopilin PulG
MREGWTVIELIFILVVIGILAALAIPRLAATRNDAKLSADVANMNICLGSVAMQYTATKIMDINITACNNVVCYTIDTNDTVMHIDINASAADYCDDIENVGGHLIRDYQFAGKRIKR